MAEIGRVYLVDHVYPGHFAGKAVYPQLYRASCPGKQVQRRDQGLLDLLAGLDGGINHRVWIPVRRLCPLGPASFQCKVF